MRAAFINAPFKIEQGRFSRSSRSPAIAKSGTVYYPIWLAYAAGVLDITGFETIIVDAPAERLTDKIALERVRDFDPKLVVFDTSTPSIYSDVRFGAMLKDVLPETFVVLVGTHPSALPEETLRLDNKIDAIAVGEYDYTLRELARTIEEGGALSEVAGLIFRQEDKIVVNGTREHIQELDALPFVSEVYKNHLDYKNYFESMAKYPMVMIITGRGCPFKCAFCVYPQTMHGRKYRLRSPENVVDEFRYILDNFPDIQEVGIEDDTFTADPHRVSKICKLLIDAGINKKIKWWANARVNLDLETMKLMKAAGCRLIVPGFESGVQSMLNRLRKGNKVEKAVEYVKNAKKAGLLVHGCFIAGSPGETKETLAQSLEFAKKLKVDTMQFYPLIPYPGTEIFRWAEENGYLRTNNFEEWLTPDGLHNAVIDTKDLSADDLMAFCHKARKSFYLRPSYIARKALQSISDLEEGRRNLKAFLTFLPHLTKSRTHIHNAID